jgi:hypothetical protein
VSATIVFEDEDRFDDGSRYETIVLSVDPSDAYSEGIRYSFQYMDRGDSTLLRYDNHTDAHGHRHHRHHYAAGITGIDFEDWNSHVESFYRELDEIYDERN